MKTTLENIKNMIDVNTVIGDAVEINDGTVIVPVSRVCFAFAAGGGEYKGSKGKEENEAPKYPFAGGSGAGITVQPIGFLATANGQLKVIPVRYGSAAERIVDMMPDFIGYMESIMNKKKNTDEETVK